MNSIPRRGLLCIALFCSGLSASLYAAEPYTLDGKDLAFSRQQIAAKDPLFVQAQAALLKADLALKHPLFSVMDKTLVAASGNKHDYYSFPTGGRTLIPKTDCLIFVKMGKPTRMPIAMPPIKPAGEDE